MIRGVEGLQPHTASVVQARVRVIRARVRGRGRGRVKGMG